MQSLTEEALRAGAFGFQRVRVRGIDDAQGDIDGKPLPPQRGEVWWASLPAPVGSMPGYRRPVVVVQADAFNYLLFLRLVPVFPFWLVNIAPALFNVPLVGMLMEWHLPLLLFCLLSNLAGIYGITAYRQRTAMDVAQTLRETLRTPETAAAWEKQQKELQGADEQTWLDTRLVPPYDTSGRVIPVTGASPKETPILTMT